MSSTTPSDAWTVPIKIGMWTMFLVALIMVMVVILMN